MEHKLFADNDPICSDEHEIQELLKDIVDAYTIVDCGVCKLSGLGRRVYLPIFMSHGYTEEDYNTVPKFLEVYLSIHKSTRNINDFENFRIVKLATTDQ